jgi:hypothetical protein
MLTKMWATLLKMLTKKCWQHCEKCWRKNVRNISKKNIDRKNIDSNSKNN